MSGHSLAADKLVALVLAGQSLEGRVNDSSTQAKHKVKGGLCTQTLGSAESHRKMVEKMPEEEEYIEQCSTCHKVLVMLRRRAILPVWML